MGTEIQILFSLMWGICVSGGFVKLEFGCSVGADELALEGSWTTIYTLHKEGEETPSVLYSRPKV